MGDLFMICFWDKELIGTIHFSLDKVAITLTRADITLDMIDVTLEKVDITFERVDNYHSGNGWHYPKQGRTDSDIAIERAEL